MGRALSIRQPWAHAILHFGKRVENREWERAPEWMIGKTFLLHAAKGCTRDEYLGAAAFMEDICASHPWEGSTILPGLPKLTRGAIIGRAKLAGVVSIGEVGGHAYPVGPLPMSCAWCGEHANAPGGYACRKANPWAIPGALGLLLADVETIDEPVPFKGALGFFEVPEATLRGRRWTAVGVERREAETTDRTTDR